jgi:serine/threonine-protein kinase
MATVYLASDRRLTRTVAIKVMHDNLGDDAEFVSRFDREARAAARLSHPNVVSVFDQGVDNGRPYIVMEYVEGCTLRHLITREAPFDPDRALDLLLPVINAVAAAHEAGIIHRDLKPENVLISDRGQIKVADFGLARAVSAQTATQTGVLIGTVSYIAPELVTKGRADTRCDVYALGVILFEMLTGRKPHTGDTPIQVAYSHVHNEVPAPSEQMTPSWRNSRHGIPPFLDALVVTAAARDPRLRPVDATVLLDHARQARAALASGVVDDALLTARMRQTTLELATQLTQQVPVVPGDTGVQRTATLRFTPSTPTSPGHPQVADGMPYYDAPPPRTPPRAPSPAAPSSQASAPGSPLAPAVRQRQRRRRRRGTVALVLVLVVALALGIGGWWLFSGRFVATPAFGSLTEAQARTLAAQHELEVDFSQDYSETVPSGQVIRSNPPEGAPVLRGGTVQAVLSKGPERYQVPALTGKTEAQAQAALEANHLVKGKVKEVFHDTAVIGTVVSFTPYQAGQLVKPGTEVALQLSKGPAPVAIEDFTGKPFTDAEAHYTAEGLVVDGSQRKFSKKIPEGSVISQDPSEGELAKGATIVFVVSKGPELVRVPDVQYKSIDEATKLLKDVGFKVAVRYQSNWLGVVGGTEPGIGEQAPKGSTVTLVIV